MSEQIKVVLIGRHISDLPENIEVVEQRNIVWSTDFNEAKRQLFDELYSTLPDGVGVLFQNTPGILTAVMTADEFPFPSVPTGIIISVPDPASRAPAQKQVFKFSSHADMEAAQELVKFANGRAKSIGWIENNSLEVEVEQVTPFKFSHIHWCLVRYDD